MCIFCFLKEFLRNPESRILVKNGGLLFKTAELAFFEFHSVLVTEGAECDFVELVYFTNCRCLCTGDYGGYFRCSKGFFEHLF